MTRLALLLTLLTLLTAATAHADDDESEEGKPKEPKAGDFDAGGQARFPGGPDEMGEYASFNWVAVDLQGRYFLLRQLSANVDIPLAIIHPDTYLMAAEPSTFGGFTLTLDGRVKVPKLPGTKGDSVVGAGLTFGYMKEGAMLLSKKDFPLFIGKMQPGVAASVLTRIKLGKVVDISLVPAWVYQSGTDESLTALQIPFALEVALGNLAKVNLELGIYTGDDYSFSGDEGGRLATGVSLDLRLGPILLHGGVGVASLLTGGFYPTISDSLYFDLNVKYAK